MIQYNGIPRTFDKGLGSITMIKSIKGCLFFLLLMSTTLHSQVVESSSNSWFAPSDTFNQDRFRWSLGIATTTYTGFSIGLWHAWYKQYPQESFHLFDDRGEWNNMDKIGHVYTAYFQGVLCYQGAKWTGLSDNKALLTGAICGGLFQTTIEVMDGFSTNWGFSIPDFMANVGGISLYAAQQQYWGEQRIRLKVSNVPVDYPRQTFYNQEGIAFTTLQDRVDDLYGTSFAERFLKDYNAQTHWASINIASFLPDDSKWPDWLSLAVGYGAENLYGGFENAWEVEGIPIRLGPDFDRYHQFYLGFDLDMTKVKTDNYFLRGLLQMFNIFKVPSPAIELNSRGEFTFHFFR